MTVAYDVIVPGNSLRLRDGFLGLSSIVLVQTEAGPMLVDCGHHVTRGALIEGLQRNGLTPDDIAVVFLTHLHFDHCNNIDLFPGARVLVGRREWDYAEAPHPDDDFVPWLIKEQLRRHRLELVDGEAEICAGVRHLPAPGHTPGLMALVIDTDDRGRVVLASDAIKHVKEALTERCDMAFDTVEAGTATIRKLLAIGDRIVPGHFPELIRRDGAWVWDEPASLNLVIR